LPYTCKEKGSRNAAYAASEHFQFTPTCTKA
jgi:hypothetical protein